MPMFFDSHVHTELSFDSKMKIEDAINKAESLGLGIITTEHYDYDEIESGIIPVDCEKYFNEYSKYRGDKLRLGIEIGMTAQTVDTNRNLCQSYDFDFILGAVHISQGKEIYKECASGRQVDLKIEDYLLDNIEMVEQNPYIQSLAHIDYISRYGSRKDVNGEYRDYAKLYDRLFEALLDNNCLIEVNSRRFIDNSDCYKYLYTIYARYREMGGKYVTVGSDAHFPDWIGANFKNVMKLVSCIDLEPVYFAEGKMNKCSDVKIKAFF